jgi:hypothetical protein
MPRVGFEPKTPVFEREDVHALDRAANTLVKCLTIKLLQVAIKIGSTSLYFRKELFW